MKIPAWLRRNRAAAWPPEHAERLADRLQAVDTVYPDSSIPDTTQWPETCTPGDPCGMKFSNEADRGEWYDCPNHQPKGRHRIRPAIYADITSAPDGTDG